MTTNASFRIFIGVLFASITALSGYAQNQIPNTAARFTAERWRLIRPGLEYGIYFPSNTNAQLIVTRIDPDLFAFGVVYRPSTPLELTGWTAEIPCAVGILNANFFHGDYTVRGMIVADGEMFGEAFEHMGGLLYVDVRGEVGVRSTLYEAYVGESLVQAVQGFPVLVYDGEALYRGGGNDEPTRRTVIGQDADGRIVVITVTGVGMYLDVLAEYLVQTDLRLDIAVNFDGGTSTMLKVDSLYGNVWTVESAYPVPAIVAIYAREPEGLCAPESVTCSCPREVVPQATEAVRGGADGSD